MSNTRKIKRRHTSRAAALTHFERSVWGAYNQLDESCTALAKLIAARLGVDPVEVAAVIYPPQMVAVGWSLDKEPDLDNYLFVSTGSGECWFELTQTEADALIDATDDRHALTVPRESSSPVIVHTPSNDWAFDRLALMRDGYDVRKDAT